jgi:hypothetical protein
MQRTHPGAFGQLDLRPTRARTTTQLSCPQRPCDGLSTFSVDNARACSWHPDCCTLGRQTMNSKKVRALLSICAGLYIGSGICPIARAAEESASAVSLQGGWWSVEGEWKARSGIYAAVGVPWMGALLSSGGGWTVPLGARVGYQYEASPAWKLRGSARVAGTYGADSSCGCQHRVTRTFGFLEFGIRYEAPSGFVAGLDLPLLAFDQAHDLARGRTEGIEVFPPPLSLAFSQMYLGYSWSF